MPQYRYKAITKDGLIVRNKVESPSKQTLIRTLKSTDLTPIDVEQVAYSNVNSKTVAKKKNAVDIDEIMKTANSATINQGKNKKRSTYEKINMTLSTQQKIKDDDLKTFTENFYLLKKADFNNIHALSAILNSIENFTFRGVIEDILAGVEAGEYMYTTMEYYSNVFPYVYTNMIKVGELSGTLTQSLEQARKYLDSTSDVERKLKSILVPNILQLIGLLALLIGGTMWVVPNIQGIYDSVGSNQTLPGITLAFANFLALLKSYWYIPCTIIAGLVVGFFMYINTPKGRYNFDYFKYTMPIFGKLNFRIDFSRLMKAMALNLENGMRIQESLDICRDVNNNFVMKALIENSINNILVGNSWIEPFENSGLASGMTIEMLKVGMQTNLTEMMHKLLEYIELEINQTMNRVMSVLPQVVYGIVGILLIFVVLVVLVPCINVYMGTFLFEAAGV